MLVLAGSMVSVTAKTDRVKPKQGGFPCPGTADTFVYGLGRQGPHYFTGAGWGVDHYYDPDIHLSYTGGRYAHCYGWCYGNPEDKCTVTPIIPASKDKVQPLSSR